MRSKRIMIGLKKIIVNWNWASLLVNENLQRKQNWTAESTNVNENAEKLSQFLSSEQPSEAESLDVVLNISGVENIRSENLRLRSTLEAIRFEFWMKGALVTVEICVLCGW